MTTIHKLQKGQFETALCYLEVIERCDNIIYYHNNIADADNARKLKKDAVENYATLCSQILEVMTEISLNSQLKTAI